LDEQLKEEIIISIKKTLLPAYGNFIVKKHGKHADKNIKYGMDDIEARLDNLFHGSSASTETDSRK
jgi:hypothetical protein